MSDSAPHHGGDASGLGRFVERAASLFAMIGGLALLFITVLTCVSIAGRSLLPLDLGLGPVPGDFEMVEIAAGLAVFFFLPYCQLNRGHVTVDIFVPLLGERGTAITELVGNVLMTAAAAIIVWRLVPGLGDKMRSGEESFILGLPVWWGFVFALIGAVAFLLVCAYTVRRSLAELATARSRSLPN